ncbi:MAG: OmdA domain containing protein [Actinobacteria bacterium]|nr:OmdA domain containing protein [Actinomycetota bacterium]
MRWESWLADNHELPGGVWLKIAKKGSGETSVSRAEALDAALCYGWIDSKAKSLDEACYLQKFTRRRARSLWSKVNVEKVEALIAAGRMQAPGLAEILAAQADGRWDAAYESPTNAVVPPDLAAALAHSEQARDFYLSLSRADQYAVVFRLMTTPTPAGRAGRLQRMIAKLEAGDRSATKRSGTQFR